MWIKLSKPTLLNFSKLAMKIIQTKWTGIGFFQLLLSAEQQ